MKKLHIILAILVLTLSNGKAGNSEVHNNQAMEQTAPNADSNSTESSEKPIIKTTIIEDDEETTTVSAPRNKWITAGLAVLGVVLVIVFRMLRKKKKPLTPTEEKKPE